MPTSIETSPLLSCWVPLPRDFDLGARRASAGRLAARRHESVASVRIGPFEVEEELFSHRLGSVYAASGKFRGDATLLVVKRRFHGPDGGWAGHVLARLNAMPATPVAGAVAAAHVGCVDGQLYLEYPAFGPTTLARWLAERAPRQVLDMYLAVGAILAGAHRCGLVHGDFAPDYVLVDELQRPQVFGFGLSRALGLHLWGAPATLLGNPNAAPELIATAGAPAGPTFVAADERSDQYCFAVALRQALLRVAELPSSLVHIFQRATHGQPEQRYPGMQALLVDLRAVRLPGEQPKQDVRATPRIRSIMGRVAASAAVALGFYASVRIYQEMIDSQAHCDERWAALSTELARALTDRMPERTWTAVLNDIPTVREYLATLWQCMRIIPPQELPPARASCVDMQQRRMAHIAGLVGDRHIAPRRAAYLAGVSLYLIKDPAICDPSVDDPVGDAPDLLRTAYAEIENYDLFRMYTELRKVADGIPVEYADAPLAIYLRGKALFYSESSPMAAIAALSQIRASEAISRPLRVDVYTLLGKALARTMGGTQPAWFEQEALALVGTTDPVRDALLRDSLATYLTIKADGDPMSEAAVQARQLRAAALQDLTGDEPRLAWQRIRVLQNWAEALQETGGVADAANEPHLVIAEARRLAEQAGRELHPAWPDLLYSSARIELEREGGDRTAGRAWAEEGARLSSELYGPASVQAMEAWKLLQSYDVTDRLCKPQRPSFTERYTHASCLYETGDFLGAWSAYSQALRYFAEDPALQSDAYSQEDAARVHIGLADSLLSYWSERAAAKRGQQIPSQLSDTVSRSVESAQQLLDTLSAGDGDKVSLRESFGFLAHTRVRLLVAQGRAGAARSFLRAYISELKSARAPVPTEAIAEFQDLLETLPN